MPKPSEPAKGRKSASFSSGKQGGESMIAASVLLPIPSSRIGLWAFQIPSQNFSWTENCVKIFGVGASCALPADPRQLISVIHEHDRKNFENTFEASVRSRADFSIDVRVIAIDGSFRWIEFSGEFQPCDELFLKGVVQDVTRKKLTELELVDWRTRNELVSESAGLLIYDYDLATGEIFWSGNTVQLVGFTPFEIGRVETWEELIHPDDRNEVSRALEEARCHLKPFDVYYRFRKKDWEYLYVHDRGQFVGDGQGEAVRMLGVMTDVSERVAAERMIKQSEKSFRDLFNSVGEAICIQRADGTIVDVNQGTCELYGYAKEELLGKDTAFLGAVGKNNLEDLRRKMEEALKGRPQAFQWRGRKKNGRSFILEVKLTKGTYFGDDIIISTSWDITEKIRQEQSLQESEKRFRMLIQDLNVGVILQNASGKIEVVNKAALRLLGVPEDFLTEKTLHSGDWKFITEEGAVLSDEQKPWNFAAKMRTAVRGFIVGIERSLDKRTVWALVNAEPILQQDDTLLQTVITLTDVSDRRKVMDELKESELRFRTLQEASFGGIGLHNKGVIIDCNQGLCDITGFTHEELVGANGLNLIAPEYRDFVYRKILDKFEDPYDVEGIRKDGSRYYLEIHGKNIPYQEGLIRVTEFRDITDRKAVESKIIEQNAKLVSITEDLKIKNEQLNEFTQIVSHNLRSPVGNILSLLNFIENAESEEERGEYITLLREAGATTLTTLHELNEVLQIKQNKHIEKQKLEFEQVFSNVRSMMVAKIVECNAEIRTDFSGASTIEYPNIYLESILLNLVSNALKYHHPERRPVIEIRTFRKDGITSMTVSDNGQGINMQRYGHHIFKLRKTFHKHPESRGIGLFMIKNQIDAMGGDISVSSIENEGTNFLINFNGKISDDEHQASDNSIS